jgi:hypothetical protein
VTVLSKQAKAIAAGIALLLVQVQVFVGQGGVDVLLSVTLGQWITVALGVLAGYGVVYNIPNAYPVEAAEFAPVAPALRPVSLEHAAPAPVVVNVAPATVVDPSDPHAPIV